MKIFSFCTFCILALLFLSCGQKPNNDPASGALISKEDSIEAPFLFDCFKSVDTAAIMETKGCGNCFYKVISRKHVLMICYNGALQYDSCVHVTIDAANPDKLAELIVFKDGEANLFDYCNDYGNGIIPIRSIKNAAGDFYIKLYQPSEYRGTKDPTASIFIRHLAFIDSTANANINIDNELFWKVCQVGLAG